jgi:hypothetical protein
MAPPSDHYRFEQVGDSAWAAIATEAGAAVGNAGIAEGFQQNIDALRGREAA